jgi:hypothetical protein
MRGDQLAPRLLNATIVAQNRRTFYDAPRRSCANFLAPNQKFVKGRGSTSPA